MKLYPKKNLIPLQTFETPHQQAMLTPPNPPTEQAIKKAQFKDKTYAWKSK
jgi:hypothetical protein